MMDEATETPPSGDVTGLIWDPTVVIAILVLKSQTPLGQVNH